VCGIKVFFSKFRVCESRPVDKSNGLRCDQSIRLNTAKGKTSYPQRLRRIGYYDVKTGKRLTFLTNHFDLPALTVAAIYKKRWQIELFFKWIKQNLRIKVFYGTTEDAVYTQNWIAVCTYLMVACLNKTHRVEESSSRMLQILSVNIFQKQPVNELLTKQVTEILDSKTCNQLMLNGF
jgi:IS4 transposase